MTSFSGLTNASAAMNAERRAMQIAGQNIANADTVGVAGTSRRNDAVIDARTEHSRSGYFDSKAATISSVETYFDEPSDTGLSEQLNKMWTSWATVSRHPGNGSARAELLQRAQSVTDTLNGMSTNIATLSTSVQQALAGSALTAGQAQALAELLNTILPGYQSQLDAVAAALADMVNAQHATGQDLAGTVGAVFFTGTTAATITVAITDPSKIAAAVETETASLDGSNAQAIAQMSRLPDGADAAYRTLVANLGSDSAQSAQQSATQSAITSNVDTLQSRASGVNDDDEVTNLLTFQRAYQASSRVLITVDEILDTLNSEVIHE